MISFAFRPVNNVMELLLLFTEGIGNWSLESAEARLALADKCSTETGFVSDTYTVWGRGPAVHCQLWEEGARWLSLQLYMVIVNRGRLYKDFIVGHVGAFLLQF